MTILVFILLCLVPVFQGLCYRLFLDGWWPFFSFLIIGTLALICLGLAGMFLDINAKVTPHRWKVLAWTIFGVTILNIILGLWVFWLVPFEVFTFVHILVIIQDLVSIILLFYIKGAAIFHIPEYAERTPRTIVSEPIGHKQEPADNPLDCIITTGQDGRIGRTWYYIHAKENPKLECVVDCVRMKEINEDYIGRTLFSQIASGKEIGVRISGYAIFVHPSQKTKRGREIVIDKSLLPQIQSLADTFYKTRSCGQLNN